MNKWSHRAAKLSLQIERLIDELSGIDEQKLIHEIELAHELARGLGIRREYEQARHVHEQMRKARKLLPHYCALGLGGLTYSVDVWTMEDCTEIRGICACGWAESGKFRLNYVSMQLEPV